MSTIKNVAKEAGVSISTVSLALNGSKAVKEETRRRVVAAARKLSYTPNPNARSLVTKKNLVIGVVRCTDDISDSAYGFDSTVDTYLAEMLKSIEQGSFTAGYSLMVDWSETYTDKSELPPMFQQGKVDGVLMVGGIINEKLPEMIARSAIPTVLVGSRSAMLDCVDTSYRAAIRMAVEYLVEMGHREIAFINGPDTSQTSAQKLQGYREGLQKAGLPFNEALVSKSNFSGYGGYTAMRGLVEKGIGPKALIAAVDCIALGALRYLSERSLYCPRDISVVGFEDGILAEYALPPLTTVSAQKHELGKRACKMLLGRIAEPDAPHQLVLLEPKLVVRESVRRWE
ncbi:MAG: LacI family DNA-binding transcriptional regulator [Candidatus Limiplasma sp.]|nr:LacI family DNA-binding transcriptional regulator [Candidatus Limiplasma sp.]